MLTWCRPKNNAWVAILQAQKEPVQAAILAGTFCNPPNQTLQSLYTYEDPLKCSNKLSIS